MMPGTAPSLQIYAGVVVRVGLNLQPGQDLLIAEPYELQGVSRSAAALVEAVGAEARRAGAGAVETIWGNEQRLRSAALNWPDREFESLLEANARRMHRTISAGGALLFLCSGHPELTAGLPARQVAALRRCGWEHYGAVAQRLVAGQTNWTAVPAPTATWARHVFADLPEQTRLDLLWQEVLAACRCDRPDPLGAWREHLAALGARRDELNAQRISRVDLHGPGTGLTLSLPAGHTWCSAGLRTPAGINFVANLPTEELFTAPARESAHGVLRVARPITYGGGHIDGIELVFRRGRVRHASARTGGELLERLLDTDPGARHLGEVALVPAPGRLAASGRCFGHALLDENALPHLALGDAYSFCADPEDRPRLNRSLVHVDLPIEAEVTLTRAPASPP